jgi:hypothetical protein
MNKRSLAVVGSVLVLAFFSLLAGCRHKTHVVRFIVHGSVITASTNEGTTIVVPAVDSEDLQHFLAAGYPSLGEAKSTPCAAGAYEFKLKGIKPAEKKAGANGDIGDVIDPAFDAITFTRPNWKPLGGPYFVTMQLPAASRIVALGARYPVQFNVASGPDFVPLTQMLEFEAHDGDDVRLVRTCGSEKKEYEALSCKDMRARYDQAFKETPEEGGSKSPDRPYLDFALKSCADDASYLFIGIGIDPKNRGSSEVHGRNFFNTKILPEIYGGKDNVPPDKKLVEHGHLTPNGGSGSDNRGVRLIKTSFDGEYPRYVPVLMIENCTSPGGFVHP